MGIVDTRVAPYYDTTTEEVAKNYHRLLAIPGRVAQAREITVLQGLLQASLKSIGDAVMSNGDIIEGCQVITATDKKSVTVTAGKIYMEGTVISVPESTVSIKGEGNETIGVKINETIITDSVDSSLKDPAQGYDNYGQSGCNRVKRELIIVANDPDASVITQLIDGDIAVETYAPNYDTMMQTLARRTYDESGSYIVEGLKSHVEYKDANNFNVVVEAGKAYILGYELKIPTARRITLPRSVTTSVVNASNYVFKTGTLKYQLDSDPYVASINYLRGRIEITEQQTLTTNTDAVPLNNNDVVSIESVVKGSTNYVVGTGPDNGDCYLMRDGTRFYVKWNGGTAPSAGESYTVKYQYNTNFTEDTDYTLEVTSAGSYVVFASSGMKPINNTNFTVNYQQYLARKDLVYIDQYGTISVIQGSPDEYGYEGSPATPVNTLALARISSPPNGFVNSNTKSLNITVENIGLTRFTMQDIQNLLTRIKRTEYNQAILTLNDDARTRTTTNSKKGILTDPLVDFSRIDLYYNILDGEPIDISKPVYSMALDLDVGYGYLPLNIYTYDLNTPTGTFTKYNRLVGLPTTGERTILSQPNATKSFQINPYSVFPQMPDITISPAVDNWVEDTIVQVPVSLTNSTIVETTTNILYNTVRSTWQESSTTITSSTYKDVQIGTTTSKSVTESLISEEAITYIRRREINVTGKNYPPNIDNILCTFDGVPVNLTPTGSTTAGTTVGSIKADGNGDFTAKFTIPANIRTGSREVKLYSTTVVDGYQNTSYTIYQASGISRTYQQTLTTITTVLLQRQVTQTANQVIYIDPVGQSFVLDNMSVIKAIDLYFESKPDTNEDIVVELRGVSNGTINSTIYASKALPRSSVNISSDASVATRFTFDDPVIFDKDTEYAFVVRSMSDKYRIWVSEIGGKDVKSGETILKNSYLTGVMFSSSNNSTWTAHQTMDIKFKLIEDVYATSGVITFAPITTDNITRIDLTADSAVLNNTSVKWMYSIDGGNTYYSVTPGVLRELGEIVTNVIFKVELSKSTSENISPLIALDTLYLIGSSYKTEGWYIGVNVSGVDTYTTADVILNRYTPAGTNIQVYISTDEGDTMQEMTIDDTQTKQLNNGWQEVVYQKTGLSATKGKIFIKATSSSTTVTPKFSSMKFLMS